MSAPYRVVPGDQGNNRVFGKPDHPTSSNMPHQRLPHDHHTSFAGPPASMASSPHPSHMGFSHGGPPHFMHSSNFQNHGPRNRGSEHTQHHAVQPRPSIVTSGRMDPTIPAFHNTNHDIEHKLPQEHVHAPLPFPAFHDRPPFGHPEFSMPSTVNVGGQFDHRNGHQHLHRGQFPPHAASHRPGHADISVPSSDIRNVNRKNSKGSKKGNRRNSGMSDQSRQQSHGKDSDRIQDVSFRQSQSNHYQDRRSLFPNPNKLLSTPEMSQNSQSRFVEPSLSLSNGDEVRYPEEWTDDIESICEPYRIGTRVTNIHTLFVGRIEPGTDQKTVKHNLSEFVEVVSVDYIKKGVDSLDNGCAFVKLVNCS